MEEEERGGYEYETTRFTKLGANPSYFVPYVVDPYLDFSIRQNTKQKNTGNDYGPTSLKEQCTRGKTAG